MAFHNDYMEDDQIGQEMDNMLGLRLPKLPSAPDIRISGIDSPVLERSLPVSRAGDNVASREEIPGTSFPGEARSVRASYPNLAVPVPKYRNLEPSNEGVKAGEPVPNLRERESSAEEEEECCSWGPACLVGAACGIMGASAAVGGILSTMNSSAVEDAKEEVENSFSIDRKNMEKTISDLKDQVGSRGYQSYATDCSEFEYTDQQQKHTYCEAVMALLPDDILSISETDVATFIGHDSWYPEHSIQDYLNGIVLPELAEERYDKIHDNAGLLNAYLLSMMWRTGHSHPNSMNLSEYSGNITQFERVIEELSNLHEYDSSNLDNPFLLSSEFHLPTTHDRKFEKTVYSDFDSIMEHERDLSYHFQKESSTAVMTMLQSSSPIELACGQKGSWFENYQLCKIMMKELAVIEMSRIHGQYVDLHYLDEIADINGDLLLKYYVFFVTNEVLDHIQNPGSHADADVVTSYYDAKLDALAFCLGADFDDLSLDSLAETYYPGVSGYYQGSLDSLRDHFDDDAQLNDSNFRPRHGDAITQLRAWLNGTPEVDGAGGTYLPDGTYVEQMTGSQTFFRPPGQETIWGQALAEMDENGIEFHRRYTSNGEPFILLNDSETLADDFSNLTDLQKFWLNRYQDDIRDAELNNIYERIAEDLADWNSETPE